MVSSVVGDEDLSSSEEADSDESSMEEDRTQQTDSLQGGRRDLQKSLKSTKWLLANRKRKCEHGLTEPEAEFELDLRFLYRNPKKRKLLGMTLFDLLPNEIVDKIYRMVVVDHKKEMMKEVLEERKKGRFMKLDEKCFFLAPHIWSVGDLKNKLVIKSRGLCRILKPVRFTGLWIQGVMRWRHRQKLNGLTKRPPASDAQIRGWIKTNDSATLCVNKHELFCKIYIMSTWTESRWKEYLQYD